MYLKRSFLIKNMIHINVKYLVIFLKFNKIHFNYNIFHLKKKKIEEKNMLKSINKYMLCFSYLQ